MMKSNKLSVVALILAAGGAAPQVGAADSNLKNARPLYLHDLAGKPHVLYVTPATTVWQLQQKVQDFTGLAPECQRLTYQGHILHGDSALLTHYGVQADSTLHLQGSLKGGCGLCGDPQCINTKKCKEKESPFAKEEGAYVSQTKVADMMQEYIHATGSKRAG